MADDASWRGVPTPLQELASILEEPPSRYVLQEKERPSTLLVSDDMPEPLPVINLSRLSSDDAAEAAKLDSALQTWGLVLVTNHGMESLMDDMMRVSREFFHQPLERKPKYGSLEDGILFRLEGYGSDSVATQDQILNWSDRMNLMVLPEDQRNYTHWPKHPESFREVLHEYALKTKMIRDGIFRAMAKILGLDEDYIISQAGDKAVAFARFNYYPPCPRPDLVNGIQPHSDSSILTIVLIDKEVRGLQVQRDGIWYNVPPKPYTLLVNLGDCMEIMSNGIFKSPMHKVVTNAEQERISLVLFFHMGGDKTLEPAAKLVEEKRPARYRKSDMVEFYAGVSQQFFRGKRFIESLKI